MASTRSRLRHRGRSAAAVVALAVCAVAAVSFPAVTAAASTAAPSVTVAADSVRALSDPGTTLAVPADGRLRGYRFAGQITGVATGSRLDTSGTVLAAGPGQQLWDFGLEWSAGPDNSGSPQPVTATLIVDGTRIAIPTNAPSGKQSAVAGSAQTATGANGAPGYWLASVPKTATDVAVELASAGYAQTFSLTRMTREGPQPPVLYRDPASWQVSEPLAAEHDIATPDPDGYTPNAFLPVSLSGVTLTWFGPDRPGDIPADPQQAWLIPKLNSLTYTNSGTGMCFPSLPGSDVTLTVPGEPPIPATTFPGLGTDRPSYGAFTDGYAFQVPADITTATLTVTPGTMAAATENCAINVTVTATGSAVFPLNIPGAAYQTPAGASATPAAIRTLTATSQPGTPPGTKRNASTPAARGGSTFPTLAVALILVILAAGGAGATSLMRRRRKPDPPSNDRRRSGPTPDPSCEPYADGRTRQSTRPTDTDTDTASEPMPPRMPTQTPAPTPSQTPSTPAPPTASVPSLLPDFDPDAAVEADIPTVEILGTVRTAGWPASEVPTSRPVLELAVFLALHPGRGYTAEALRQPLSGDADQPLSTESVRTYASTLRRILGARHVPEGGRAGYSLQEVTSDWGLFTRLAAAGDPRSLAEALRLVRGQPLSDAPAGTRRWADEELLCSQIEVAVADTAASLAAKACQAGDANLGAWAAERGLRVTPQSQTLGSWALRAAGAHPDADSLEQAWRDTLRRYTPDNPPAALTALYRTLAGQRPPPSR